MAKTRAEKYELYEDISVKGSKSFSPAIILNPNTEVEIVQKDAGFYQKSYHFVAVEEGPHKDKAGYVPAFALLECDVLQSKVGLATVATTGVTYGGRGVPKGDTVQSSFLAHGHGLHFELPFKGKEGCPYCGGVAASHTMEESQEARNLAREVHAAIRGWKNNVGGQFMIGVLKVLGEKSRTLLAVSDGFTGARESPTTKDPLENLETVADTLKLRLITRSEVKDWEYLRDFTGKKITEVGEAKINIKNMHRDFLQCAGPKLLQYVLHSYQTDEVKFQGKLFLSEIWYEPRNVHDTYGDASTAESCGKCAILIPRMLCGYKPKK
jgi:hypothetical protein